MHSIAITIGDCPHCGDEIYLFKTRSNKRLAKCVNEQCPKKLAYPLPHAGKIECTHEICPQSQLPLLVVIPNMKLTHGRIKANRKQLYFWADRACFGCSKNRQCKILKDMQIEYQDRIEEEEGA
jgi:ssDNA-binding Zn-finger/Zn-ribbon topoisomerase 1